MEADNVLDEIETKFANEFIDTINNPVAKAYFAAIKNTIWECWDICGVNGIEGCYNEYDRYIPNIALVAMNADEQQLCTYLINLGEYYFASGIFNDNSPKVCAFAAQKLHQIAVDMNIKQQIFQFNIERIFFKEGIDKINIIENRYVASSEGHDIYDLVVLNSQEIILTYLNDEARKGDKVTFTSTAELSLYLEM